MRRVLDSCADLKNWPVCHGPDDVAGSAWPESRTQDVAREDEFAPAQMVVREANVPVGLVVHTPWASQFLGLTASLRWSRQE